MVPVPFAALNAFIVNRSDDVGAFTETVHFSGLAPVQPGDPEDVFAMTGVPPLTLIDTDFVAEALDGIVTTTLALTVTKGPIFA
jgi:hypothetical protein